MDWRDGGKTGLLTFTFTDIEGYSSLETLYRESMQPLLDKHNAIIRRCAELHGGDELRVIGDAFFLVFDRAGNAANFAFEAQREIARTDWIIADDGKTISLEFKVRLGMHTGEARPLIHPNGQRDYFGTAVNTAARVSSAGHGGQVLLSDTTRKMVEDEVDPGISFLDLGEHRLKGVGEERLWQLCHADLSADFPPLLTLNARKHNLPAPLTPLLGRDDEMARWYAAIKDEDTRLLTLYAFGGMGKTRAALQLAEHCSGDNLDCFSDGVWWVGLEEARTGDEMVARIISAVGLRAPSHAPLRPQLVEFLRTRHLLLVLDNTEQIPEAGAVVKELLTAAGGIKCLVTTRQPLGLVGEVRMEVTPLAQDEALRFFEEKARNAGSQCSADDPHVRELCRRLEGVPLALELAASRCTMLSPSEIVERLDDQLKLLSTRAPDLPLRQRALRAAIDWSYMLLAPEERKLFAELSVFAGGFTLIDAESVGSSDDAFDGITELLSNSLLRNATDATSQRTRYFMLESVRAYGAEKLATTLDGGRAIEERHALHFLALTQKFAAQLRSGTEGDALSKCGPHLDNARAALRHAQGNEGLESVAEGLSLVLGQLLTRFGLLREATECIQTGLDCFAKAPDSPHPVRARLLLERGWAYYDTFDWENAALLAEKARIAMEESDDCIGQADAWNLLAYIALKGYHDLPTAIDRFSRPMPLYARAGFTVGLGLVRNGLGLAEHARGNTDAARSHFAAALACYYEEGYQRGIAEVSLNLGVLELAAPNHASAWRHYESALEIELALRNQFGVARALYNLGELASIQGKPTRAFRLFGAAEALFERGGSPYRHHAAKSLDEIIVNLPSQCDFAVDIQAVRSELKDKSDEMAAHWAMQDQV